MTLHNEAISDAKCSRRDLNKTLPYFPTTAIDDNFPGFSRFDGDVCTAKGAFTVSAGFVSIGEVQPWAELEVFCVDAEQSGAVP